MIRNTLDRDHHAEGQAHSRRPRTVEKARQTALRFFGLSAGQLTGTHMTQEACRRVDDNRQLP